MQSYLLHIRKLPTPPSLSTRTWQLHGPPPGLPIHFSQLPASEPIAITKLYPDVTRFLIEITGKGGGMEGWMLHTISALKEEQNSADPRDVTPCFDVVFVRERAKRAKPQRAKDGVKREVRVDDEGSGSGSEDSFEVVDTIEKL